MPFIVVGLFIIVTVPPEITILLLLNMEVPPGLGGKSGFMVTEKKGSSAEQYVFIDNVIWESLHELRSKINIDTIEDRLRC